MKKLKLPNTDSIRQLAEFWDKHDLTDFDDQLEEVPGSLFAHAVDPAGTISVPLKRREAEAVEKLARAKHISREQLLRAWVLQKITARRGNGRAQSGPKQS